MSPAAWLVAAIAAATGGLLGATGLSLVVWLEMARAVDRFEACLLRSDGGPAHQMAALRQFRTDIASLHSALNRLRRFLWIP